MARGIVLAVVFLALIVCIGTAKAQEQKSEGIMGKMKSVLPGEKKDTAAVEQAASDTVQSAQTTSAEASAGAGETAQSAQTDAASTQKKGSGLMEKMKSAMGGGEKGASESKGCGMMGKMKGMLPGGKSSAPAGESGMMDKMKGIMPSGK